MKGPKLPADSWWYHVETVHEYSVDLESRTIFVAPEKEEGEVDEIMAARFLKNMSLLESRGSGEITIRFMTCGGSWDYGMAMYDAIACSPCHVTTVSYAWARSMSSIIPQAADHRIIMPDCSFMVHWGTDGYDGPATGIQAYAAFTKIHQDRMLDIYWSRMRFSDVFIGMDTEEGLRWLKERLNENVDWWLTAAEAVEFGLMDEVYAP